MPIYEYRCAPCEISFETFVRSGENEVRCPECDGRKVARVMSTFAARSANGNGASAAMEAIGSNGLGNALGNRGGGGCCSGGCGCH